jgi:fatty-acyl-CoA synthase
VSSSDTLTKAASQLNGSPEIWTHGSDHSPYPRIDHDIQQHSGVSALQDHERRQPTIQDRALYIFTSGTTGLPKAANISHARVMQWGHWFAGMLDAQPTDRMYNCLPMYHSVGGVQVPGSILVSGGTVVIREKFSASQFWNDISFAGTARSFNTSASLCRYLLHATPVNSHPIDPIDHRIRMACGNGLASEVWEHLQGALPHSPYLRVLCSNRGRRSSLQCPGQAGEPSAISRATWYIDFSPPLVKFDVEKGEPARNDQGFCIRCAPNEVGEAIGRIVDDPTSVGSRFEGYTDDHASEKKIFRDVFEPGDKWVRTGDLMRKDEKGFFYFVDRIGDTFRWKGENVSTSEVSEVLGAFPGVNHANVYGVAIPGTEGRIGMAAIVAEHALDLSSIAQPPDEPSSFVCPPRIPSNSRRCGSDGHIQVFQNRPGAPGIRSRPHIRPVYFDNPLSKSFDLLDKPLFERIQAKADSTVSSCFRSGILNSRSIS